MLSIVSPVRSIGKDVFSTIDEITREYFEVWVDIFIYLYGLAYDVGYGRPVRWLLPIGKENESRGVRCSVVDETVRYKIDAFEWWVDNGWLMSIPLLKI